MASKSKRRGRVFRASCILAALIIAGSSFAWFTSKDEVTNRLTASTDYGVSIVESFTPPKMWMPGQEVNKDVYAVNTGNIAAYVKENVGGILNYTFESKVGTWDDECLVLNDTAKTAIDGVTTNEVGGFLAWTSTNTALGELASGRENENPAVASRWTPTEEGIYIFRRSITHDVATDGDHPADDTFKYAGYYFVPGDGTTTEDTYYKIVIGDDDFRTYKDGDNDVFDIYADQTKLGGTATVNEDGTISGTPKVWYVKEKTIEDTPVNFVYEAASTEVGNVHGPRLVVEYGAAMTDTTDATVYDATAAAARARVDYVNAKGQYDQDTVKYEQAVADYTYASKLAAARNTLQAAAADMSDAYDTAYAEDSGTSDILDEKWDNLKNEANGGGDDEAASLKKDIADLAITGANGIVAGSPVLCPDMLLNAQEDTTNGGTVLSILNDDHALPENQRQLEEVWTNYQRMITLWTNIQNDITDINAALDEYDDPMITPEEAKEYESIVDTKLKDLAKNLRLYAQAYADLTADRALASYLGTDDSAALTESVKGQITTIANRINVDNNSDVTIDDDFNDAVTEFVNAYNNNEAAEGAYTTELSRWNAAKAKYDEDVAAAKKEYNDVVTKTAGKPQPGWEDAATDVDYADHSDKIVPMYSARREGQTPAEGATYDPKLSTADDYLDAATYKDADDRNLDFKYYELLEEGDSPKLPPAAAATTNTALVVAKPAGTVENVNSNTTFVDIDSTAANLYKDGTPAAGTSIQELSAALTQSTADYNAAKLAYETAQATADATSKITIYVNLADDYATYWQYAGDTESTGANTPTDSAEFYYRYLLQPGETSHKLIDSVTLANTVTATDYKNLTFDLNVTLDSAQITYADDQRTITTEAVDANDAFTLRVEDDNPASLTDDFNWVARDAASNAIYKVDGNKVTVNDYTGTGDLASYKYTVTTANGKYVGVNKAGTYYKLNAAEDALESVGENLTISVAES